MSLIQISNLTFCHDGSTEPVFRDLSLQLDTDWRLGLVGRNGRGKTTFLRLLAGAYEYSGTISAGVEFDYFPFQTPDPSEPAHSAAQRLSGGAPLWRLQRELSLLEVPEEVLARPFCLLSGGEQTKVLLAALFLREGRFPLIDEPTDHLDARGRAAVSRYLGGKKAFILVSHDRAFLDGCVDHILAMSRESIRVEKGNFSSWYRNKILRDEFEAGENEKLKKEIGRLREASRRASAWSDRAEKTKFQETASGLKPDRGYLGHKAAKMMKRSKGIEARRAAAEEEKSALLRDLERPQPLKLTPLEYGGGALLSLRGVSVTYGGRPVCPPVSFELGGNDRLALCGRNGSGKSSILKLVCGENLSHTGEVKRGGGVTISYVPQDTSFLAGSLADFASERGLDESLFKAILRKLDFSRSLFDRDMRTYSPGQKKKVLLATSLSCRAHLYVWDEPLNFIDIFSRMQLEELLLGCPFPMLFVEHDAAFTGAVATKKIFL